MIWSQSVFAVLLCLGATGLSFAGDRKTVWEGVYSAAQASRGEADYAAECSRCHRDDLSGYNNALIGGRFMDRWREDSLDNFFVLLRNTMPRNAPQSLGDEAYLDIVAYILQQNSFPAGPKDLTAAALRDIRVEGRQGPAPVPDFALVSVVGCLTQAADGTWIVTQASEPVRTRDPKDSTPEELQVLARQAPGTHTFRLMDPTSVQAKPPKGHQVEAKGFLIRQPNADGLNPTSLQSIAPACSR
ncbi:MAG: cytochrome c [Acidobacteriota bacterium]